MSEYEEWAAARSRRIRRGLFYWFLATLAILGSSLGFISVSYGQQPVNQELDVPKTGCTLFYTHLHEAGRSYQLTCAAPVPESLMVYPARTND